MQRLWTYSVLLYLLCGIPTLCAAEQPHTLFAYGKAFYTLAEGRQEAVGFINPETPFLVVPVTPCDTLDTQIGFHAATNAFIAQLSGVYLAEFSLQVQTDSTRQQPGQVVVAFRKSSEKKDSLLASTKLTPLVASPNGNSVAYGTHQELLHLRADDEVQLVITNLPGAPNDEDIWYYTGGIVTTPNQNPNQVACLTLIKVG